MCKWERKIRRIQQSAGVNTMARPRTSKTRWAIAFAGAAAAAAMVLVLFRGPSEVRLPPDEIRVKRTVTLVNDQDRVVSDEAILLDPTALFLPTRWNATQREILPREPGGIFQGYDTPKHSFGENDLKLSLPAPIPVPTGAAEAVMSEALASALIGFGRADQPMPLPPLRGGFVEIVAAASGRPVLAQIIVGGPPVSGQWQPVEFVAAVDVAGLIGPLVVTTRSGLEEVDSFFANYLIRTLRLGSRLGPGFYRIYVGP